MSTPLSSLLTSLSIAVQKANEAIDGFAAESYIQQGYDQTSDESGVSTFAPRTVIISLPGFTDGQDLRVPLSVLMNHNTLQLEEVSMNLKVALRESDSAEPEVVVNPGAKDLISEINLTFKSNPPSEGAARVQDHNIRSAFS